MKLDKTRDYGECLGTNRPHNDEAAFFQDGLYFDKEGNACDPKAVQEFQQGKVDEAVAVAEAAQAVADQAASAARGVADEAGVDVAVGEAPKPKAAAKKSTSAKK